MESAIGHVIEATTVWREQMIIRLFWLLGQATHANVGSSYATERRIAMIPQNHGFLLTLNINFVRGHTKSGMVLKVDASRSWSHGMIETNHGVGHAAVQYGHSLCILSQGSHISMWAAMATNLLE